MWAGLSAQCVEGGARRVQEGHLEVISTNSRKTNKSLGGRKIVVFQKCRLNIYGICLFIFQVWFDHRLSLELKELTLKKLAYSLLTGNNVRYLIT